MSDNYHFSDKYSLKYSDILPRNYDISKMRFTFDFIYLVLKRDASIENAIREISNEYNLSEKYLKNYLIENKYILNKNNKSEFSKQLKKFNTKRLKRLLKKHGLKTSGKREKLEERVFENDLIEFDYYISSKSKVFYKNKKRRMRIFDEYLEEYYYFDEFNEFYMNNYRKKEAKIPVEFINLHIDKALEDKNHENYIDNNEVMSQHFLKKENYRKMLGYVLKNFCMNLNPVWKIDDLKTHTGIDMITYENLSFLLEKLSKNTIIANYYLAWDSFNFDRIIVSKFEGYRILKDILNQKDFEKINDNLNNRFYMNDDLKIKRITQKTLFDF